MKTTKHGTSFIARIQRADFDGIENLIRHSYDFPARNPRTFRKRTRAIRNRREKLLKEFIIKNRMGRK